MGEADGNIILPKLPQLYILAQVFRFVSLFVFSAGVTFFPTTIVLREVVPTEIGMFESFLSGLFLFVCGVLADPCIYGLISLANNPASYFSPSEEMKNNSSSVKYEPGCIALHITICGLTASVLLLFIPNSEESLLGFIFGLMYVIAVISTILIVYYKKIINK